MRLEKPEGDVTVALLFIIWLSKSKCGSVPPCKDMQGYEAFIKSLSSPSACSCLSTKMITDPFSW